MGRRIKLMHQMMDFVTSKATFIFLIVLSGELLVSASMMEYVGVKKSLKFERLDNKLGKALVFYDMEFVPSIATKSYNVTSMMQCRTIRSASQTLNLVSVGVNENETVKCNIDYVDANMLTGLQLRSKPGMFTFLTIEFSKYFPASNGMFYKKGMTAMSTFAGMNISTWCQRTFGSGWNLAYAITDGQFSIIKQIMNDDSFQRVLLAVNCTNPKIWNDGSSFNYVLSEYSDATATLFYSTLTNQFKCGGNMGFDMYPICMRNIFPLFWKDI